MTSMPRILISTTLAIFPLTLLPAQSPIETAKADLSRAVSELNTTQKEYSDLRRSLYRDINRLDDEALQLAKELRALERAEEERTSRSKSLEREVEARKADTNYATGILNQYAKALITRLHPAENQLYLQSLEAGDQRAASLLENPAAEIDERRKLAELGAERVSSLLQGPRRFDGKALRNGNQALDGTLMLLGPSVFFSAKDQSFAGVATVAASATSLPTVVSLTEGGDTISAAIAGKSGTLPLDGTMGKALLTAESKDTLWETILKGGMVGHCILILGAISLLITIYKVVEITRFPVPDRRTINEILDLLVTGRHAEARQRAATLRGLAGEVVRTGVEQFYSKRKVLEESIYEKLIEVKPRLERFLPFLALTASTGPLLGLLGTVLGIIKTFQAMVIYGTGNAKNFSAGISEALITTAEGLVVAIPVLILHGIMKGLAKGKAGEVESIAISLVNGTSELDKKGKPITSSTPPADDDEDFELSSTTPTPA